MCGFGGVSSGLLFAYVRSELVALSAASVR